MQLTFTEPLRGLAPLTRYDLTALEGAVGLYALRSTEDPGIRLHLLDAAQYVPDYRPELPQDAVGARVFVIVTPSPTGSTVNLVAPVLVDEQAGTASQIVVPDEDLSRIRTPLGAAA